MSPFLTPSLALRPVLDTAQRNLSAAADLVTELPLPPLDPGVTPETLRMLASVYFQSQLEQTGVPLLAEALATHRNSLGLQSIEAARQVESFAQRLRRWPNLTQRQELYGRLFARNHDFERLLANLCRTLLMAAREFELGRGLRVTDEAQLRQTARALVLNLGAAHTGSSLFGGQAIQQQLAAALDLLQHPGIRAHFAARDLWGVVRAAYGENTPDLQRHLSRGHAGMRVLTWLADVQFLLSESRPTRPLLAAQDTVLVWAATWLQASGFGV